MLKEREKKTESEKEEKQQNETVKHRSRMLGCV